MRRQTHNHAVVAGRISHCRTFTIPHIPFSPISNGIVISIKSIVHTVTRQAVAFGIHNQVFESRNVLVIGLETSTRLLCAGCILVEPGAGIQHQQFIISIRTRVIGHESLLVGCNLILSFCIGIVKELGVIIVTLCLRKPFTENILNVGGALQVSIVQGKNHAVLGNLQVGFQIVGSCLTCPTVSGFRLFRSPVSGTTVSHHSQFRHIIAHFLHLSRQRIQMHTLSIGIRVVEFLVFARHESQTQPTCHCQ